MKQPLSLVSKATGGAELAGWAEVVQGEPWGVGYKKRRNFGATKPPPEPRFAGNRRDFVSFLLAGKVDPSPAPVGFHHRGSGEEGTWGHSEGPALRGALRAQQNICKKKSTTPLTGAVPVVPPKASDNLPATRA